MIAPEEVVGVAEGSESPNPVKFASELLMEVMGTDVFPSPPALDYVYRSGAKPDQKNSTRPRAMVICFHHIQDKEKAWKWSRQNECRFREVSLRFYTQTTVAMAKQCSAYNPIKQCLYEKGISSRSLSGGRLQITFQEKTETFNSPEDAKAFFRPEDQHATPD